MGQGAGRVAHVPPESFQPGEGLQIAAGFFDRSCIAEMGGGRTRFLDPHFLVKA